MTEAEAVMITEIMHTADGDCYCCAADLIEQLIAKVPEHRDAILAACTDAVRDEISLDPEAT